LTAQDPILCSGAAADIGKAEEEAVAVQEHSQCPKAVVLRPAQSAWPRIFCSVANPPSSSYPHQPQAAPQDAPPNDIIQAPARRSKRRADSYAATGITRQDSGSHGLTDVPVSGSSSDQETSKSVHADEASRQTSVERSVSPSTEALPAVMLPANQPASFSIITSGDSSQLTLKRESSVNLIHLSGKQTPPDTSEYPVERQATPSAMHPDLMTQGHDCLHLEPAALSQERIHHHNHTHHQQQRQQQPDMVQVGSCDFDSLQMYAPTGLADAQAQRYSGEAPDAQQPLQQAAWTSAHVQTDESSMLDILPMGMLHEGSSGSGSSSPKQRAGWGWSVTTGHEKHAAQYGSDQDAQVSRLPMSDVLPQALSTSDVSWEQQAWQDAWQQHQHQEQQQQQHHRQQQQACGSDQWAMLNHCFDQWQPSSVDAAVAIKHNEPDGALAGFDESEGSWWMMPHCDAKHS